MSRFRDETERQSNTTLSCVHFIYSEQRTHNKMDAEYL